MDVALLCSILLLPQTAAAIFAKMRGRNIWFWFFISFLLPVVSLIILFFLEDKSENKSTSYQLADHLRDRNQQI